MFKIACYNARLERAFLVDEFAISKMLDSVKAEMFDGTDTVSVQNGQYYFTFESSSLVIVDRESLMSPVAADNSSIKVRDSILLLATAEKVLWNYVKCCDTGTEFDPSIPAGSNHGRNVSNWAARGLLSDFRAPWVRPGCKLPDQ